MLDKYNRDPWSFVEKFILNEILLIIYSFFLLIVLFIESIVRVVYNLGSSDAQF